MLSGELLRLLRLIPGANRLLKGFIIGIHFHKAEHRDCSTGIGKSIGHAALYFIAQPALGLGTEHVQGTARGSGFRVIRVAPGLHLQGIQVADLGAVAMANHQATMGMFGQYSTDPTQGSTEFL